MIKFNKILLLFIISAVFVLTSTSVFSQSTPPLDKPIEKPQADQMSESGRIQEKIDKRRNRKNSPDSDKNHSNNPNVNPAEDHSKDNPNLPGIKLHNPPGVDKQY